MSRIVAGEWKFDFRPIDPAAIARTTIDLVQPAADAKRIMLMAELPARPVACVAMPIGCSGWCGT
jgi:hypothetical protein